MLSKYNPKIKPYLKPHSFQYTFAISSLPCTCGPSFSFISGVGKKFGTKTWMWEIFLQGSIGTSLCYYALEQKSLCKCPDNKEIL
jgi:hypothetical protein